MQGLASTHLAHRPWRAQLYSLARPLTTLPPDRAGDVVWSLYVRPKKSHIMEAFLVSTGVVLFGEMGDKTQLLAIILAATFRKPWQIVAGIFTATVVNHAAAGAV